ncbi:alpha/beta hydrolase [Terrisporobacter sp.]
MLIQCGKEELFLSDSITIVKKAKDVGVHVRVIEYKSMFHDFYIMGGFFREARKAWDEIEKFLN